MIGISARVVGWVTKDSVYIMVVIMSVCLQSYTLILISSILMPSTILIRVARNEASFFVCIEEVSIGFAMILCCHCILNGNEWCQSYSPWRWNKSKKLKRLCFTLFISVIIFEPFEGFRHLSSKLISREGINK